MGINPQVSDFPLENLPDNFSFFRFLIAPQKFFNHNIHHAPLESLTYLPLPLDYQAP